MTDLSSKLRSVDFSIDNEYMRCAAGDGDVIFAAPDVAVRANDHVLLFYEDSMTGKVEQFFRVSADFF